MATIGTFKANDNGYTGSIETLTIRAQVTFEPVENRSSDKAPHFRLFTKSGIELGAAWEASSAETGAHYLSVKLDDPSFAAPIHCRLVKSGAESGHSLLWDRQRKRA